MKSLLDYLQENHIFVNAICDGRGKCGKCKIKVLNEKPNDYDYQFLSQEEIDQGYIMACFHDYREDIEIVHEKQDGEILTSFDTRITGHSEGYGIIVDIGTTTIVMNLIDLSSGEIIDIVSTYNPQITYGGDVITRIKYDTNHPHIQTSSIRNCIKNHILPWLKYDIKQMIITGNTTMIHIFNDMNTKSIGEAPFIVPELKLVKADSKDLFNIEKSFEVITLPHISAYVGADIVSGMYALDFHSQEDIHIFLDLGTNGEIVAGNKHQMYATSSAAGPAFEGGGIECGGASINGAIYKIDDDLNIYTINNETPSCICGTGLISIIAYLRRRDLINELGRFNDGSKRFDLCDNIYITNQDIQNFLLAKAAIQTTLTIMLEKYENIEHVYISGGFGNKLNLDDLVTLNIISPEIKDKVIIKKNTAIEGVYKVLMNHDYDVLDSMIQHVESIELSTYEDFEDLLIDGLFI